MSTHLASRRSRGDLTRFGLGVLALAVLTVTCLRWLEVRNATVVGLSYLLVVLLVSAASSFWGAAATAVLAVTALNYFFMPPLGRFTIEDPQNWIALVAFLAVGLVGGRP